MALADVPNCVVGHGKGWPYTKPPLILQALADILPTLNAVLNGTTAVLLFLGRGAAKRHDEALHKKLMLGALGTSGVFLASYATRVVLTGTHRFEGDPTLRLVYLAILGTHTLLAMTLLGLVPASVVAALRGKIPTHRKLVRVTWPIWMYVSVTGVVVYVMLYHMGGIPKP